MKKTDLLMAAVLAASLSACVGPAAKILRDPEISPVGSGLTAEDRTQSSLSEVLEPEDREDAGSWIGGPADYFRGRQAMAKGDLVTVRIGLNDRAVFNNTTSRSRKAKADTNADFDVGMFGVLGAGAAEANAGSNSAASGQGSITRSERLNVTITAMVTKVYPNGLLHIEGTQQAMVNYERRDIKVAGLVNPRDIGPDNVIDFAKIAEARVVYGGAGKVSDVQKPGWGMQLWDKVNPF